VPRRFARSTEVGAAVLRRLRDAQIGADLRNPGMYAVYFYGDEGDEIRSVGGFESVKAAAEGVYLVQAETVIEEVGVDCADHA
jgi:hypothetical protein